jgi:hypothetical protein
MADLNGHEAGNGGDSQGKPKEPSEGAAPPAEEMEGRGWAEGNASSQNTPRAQDRERGVLSEWDRIGQAASTDKTRRFTTLLHHVYNIETLREAYFSLKRDAAPGVDEQTWQTYGEHLDTQLEDLSLRLRRGAYRAKPVRRVFIPKPDGRQRPLGVPTLEDKVVQRALVSPGGHPKSGHHVDGQNRPPRRWRSRQSRFTAWPPRDASRRGSWCASSSART